MRLVVRERTGLLLEFVPARRSADLEQDAERPLTAVILSEAKNLGSCKINELQRSFVAYGSPG